MSTGLTAAEENGSKVLEFIATIWAVVAVAFFAVGLALTPQDSTDANGLLWMAILAALWPFITVFAAIGLLLTVLASLSHGRG